ncbi:hypothetical protein [Terasakiella sp. SH-1]|uniref:thermonuclease family protein n=1 Tax=Terasakiella sp. SH-1 TaxID=2560057 RepID=UPI0010743EE4|nr:hypothetical protein [Terasakiella sp. SH-1]
MKRFIPFAPIKFILAVFVGLIFVGVKGAIAQTFSDTVLSLTLPYEMNLKKTGPVRLAGLLYAPNNHTLYDYLSPGDRIRVHLLSEKPDRYGRKAGHIYLKDGRWLQGELVRKGQAPPFPYSGEERFMRDLYQLEKPASLSALSDQIPTGKFAIIEGQVINVAEIKGTTYLNFGSNWRDDFTIKMTKKEQKIFRAFGLSLPTLKGHNVRIRGWVFEQNGPMIAPTHPSQLELIKD